MSAKRELNGRGATVLLSTHALAELDGHADRHHRYENGVKVADGSMDELHVQSGLPLTVNVRLKEAPVERALASAFRRPVIPSNNVKQKSAWLF